MTIQKRIKLKKQLIESGIPLIKLLIRKEKAHLKYLLDNEEIFSNIPLISKGTGTWDKIGDLSFKKTNFFTQHLEHIIERSETEIKDLEERLLYYSHFVSE